MNERGEITTFSCLLLFALTGLVLLCSLELRRSYRLMEKRTRLYLCVKESKGELDSFLRFMGRTNWGIKNLQRGSLIAVFIPGAQGAAMEAQKLKKYLQYAQEMRAVSYLKNLNSLRKKNCPLDPRIAITPYKFGERLLARNREGAAILREKKWTYAFISRPYLVTLEVDARKVERPDPQTQIISAEKPAKLSFLSSSL